MSSTIDAGGRVLIPKGIRDQLRLTPGTLVEVVLRDGAVVVMPAKSRMRLVKRGKGVVAEPEQGCPPLTDEAVRETLEAGRR